MTAPDAASAVPASLRPTHLAVGLAVVPAGMLVVFFVWPFVTLLAEVVDPGTFADTLGRPGLGSIVWFTSWQAVVSTALTLAIGLPITALVARWSFPGRRALVALISVPFMLPTVVVGAAFEALLPSPLLGTAAAVIVAHVFFNIAVVVRVVGAAWESLPTDLGAAAATLGAGPATVFREITLPLVRPAIVAAASITFLFTFTSFGVVRILGGPGVATIEVEVVRRATQLGDVGGAAVLAVLQLAALAGLLVWSTIAQRRSTVAHGGTSARRRRPRRPVERLGVGLSALVSAAIVLVPLVVLSTASLRPGGEWSTEAWRTLGRSEVRPGLSLGVDPAAALAITLRTAVAATAIAVAAGVLAALAIDAAGRRGRLLDLGVMLPLGTSAVTVGLGMLITFDRDPVDWRDSAWLVPIGHALVALPFVVRTALPALRSRPIGWLEAAATLGASPTRAWWTVDVALLRRPLVVAAGLAAAISLGEFGATTFLSRTGNETVPLAIDRLLGRAGDLPRAQGFALATILMVVTAALVLAVDVAGAGGGGRRDRIGGARAPRR